jgi:hypothetical protein
MVHKQACVFISIHIEDNSPENLRQDLKQLSFDGGISRRKVEDKNKPPVSHSVNM